MNYNKEQSMKNLISLADRTPEERTRIAKMGAAACHKAKKEKQLFRETVLELLNRNIEGTDMTYQEAIVAAQIRKALDGDTQAFNAVRDTGGQKPTDKIEASVEETIIKINVEDE